MADGAFWTGATVERARRILRKHESLATALREVSSSLGRAVTADSLYNAFKRFGHPSPQSHLAIPADPIAEQQKRDAEASRNRQVKNLVEEVRQLRSRLAFVDSIRESCDPPRIIPRESSGLREMTRPGHKLLELCEKNGPVAVAPAPVLAQEALIEKPPPAFVEEAKLFNRLPQSRRSVRKPASSRTTTLSMISIMA